MKNGQEVKLQGGNKLLDIKLVTHVFNSLLSYWLRLRSIENSNPHLPVSLLLVITKGINNSNEEVVGHAKISRLPNDLKSCWVESGIIYTVTLK